MQDLTQELSLRDDNPYSVGQILQLNASEFFLERKPLVYNKSPRDRTYMVSEGDTLSDISYLAWGTSKFHWVIQDVNNLLFSMDIQIGDILIIPDLDYLFASQPDK